MASIRQIAQKSLLGIFIAILSIFLMSHNVSATSKGAFYGMYGCNYHNNTCYWENYSYTSPYGYTHNYTSGFYLDRVVLTGNYSIKKDQYMNITFTLGFQQATNQLDISPMLYAENGFSLVSVSSTNTAPSNSLSNVVQYNFVIKAGKDFTASSTSGVSFFFTDGKVGNNLTYDWWWNGNYLTIYDSIDEASETLKNQYDEMKSEAQSSSDKADNVGNEQGSEASNAGQSIIDIFSGFITTLAGSLAGSGSNCVVSTGLAWLGNDLDLCSIDAPPLMQTLGSLISLGLFIPFAIAYFNRFIGIIRSFQR